MCGGLCTIALKLRGSGCDPRLLRLLEHRGLGRHRLGGSSWRLLAPYGPAGRTEPWGNKREVCASLRSEHLDATSMVQACQHDAAWTCYCSWAEHVEVLCTTLIDSGSGEQSSYGLTGRLSRGTNMEAHQGACRKTIPPTSFSPLAASQSSQSFATLRLAHLVFFPSFAGFPTRSADHGHQEGPLEIYAVTAKVEFLQAHQSGPFLPGFFLAQWPKGHTKSLKDPQMYREKWISKDPDKSKFGSIAITHF